MKCPLCKRRKFSEVDEEYLENTGRCKKCDVKIHQEDFRREYYERLNTKPTMRNVKDREKSHNIFLGNEHALQMEKDENAKKKQ